MKNGGKSVIFDDVDAPPAMTTRIFADEIDENPDVYGLNQTRQNLAFQAEFSCLRYKAVKKSDEKWR
ncbi:hypothetical protein [Streptococcus merionis]|uniref:hypothetical protein n=1 Tax=Streptococcus merionis TaxID=400065 RepID=UPI0026EDD1A7|nr:hypothetical protein [Streptococcus merionis]